MRVSARFRRPAGLVVAAIAAVAMIAPLAQDASAADPDPTPPPAPTLTLRSDVSTAAPFSVVPGMTVSLYNAISDSGFDPDTAQYSIKPAKKDCVVGELSVTCGIADKGTSSILLTESDATTALSVTIPIVFDTTTRFDTSLYLSVDGDQSQECAGTSAPIEVSLIGGDMMEPILVAGAKVTLTPYTMVGGQKVLGKGKPLTTDLYGNAYSAVAAVPPDGYQLSAAAQGQFNAPDAITQDLTTLDPNTSFAACTPAFRDGSTSPAGPAVATVTPARDATVPTGATVAVSACTVRPDPTGTLGTDWIGYSGLPVVLRLTDAKGKKSVVAKGVYVNDEGCTVTATWQPAKVVSGELSMVVPASTVTGGEISLDAGSITVTAATSAVFKEDSLSAIPTSFSYGSLLPVSGEVQPTDGTHAADAAGVKVTVTDVPASGGKTVTLGTAVTGADGKFSLLTQPLVSGTIKVSTAAKSGAPAIAATTVGTLAVSTATPAVTLTAPAAAITAGTKTTFSGSVSTTPGGVSTAKLKLSFYLVKADSSKVALGSATTKADGTFTVALKPADAGTIQVDVGALLGVAAKTGALASPVTVDAAG